MEVCLNLEPSLTTSSASGAKGCLDLWSVHNQVDEPTCVCIYRGCPSWNAHGKGHPTGPGGGAYQKSGSNVPTRGYHWPRVTHADSYLHTVCAFCSQFYSGQLRVTCFLILAWGVVNNKGSAAPLQPIQLHCLTQMIRTDLKCSLNTFVISMSMKWDISTG